MTIISREQLNIFKSQLRNDKKIQAVTYEELLMNTEGGKVEWQNFPQLIEDHGQIPVHNMMSIPISERYMWIGFVIIDVICLAIGAVDIRACINRATAEAVARAAEPVISQIKCCIRQFSSASSSAMDKAKAVYYCLKTIWSGGCLSAVIGEIFKGIDWYYWVLYGATAVATIVAAVATDCVSFVAQIIIEVVNFGFFVADSINAVLAWDSSPEKKEPSMIGTYNLLLNQVTT